MKINFKKEIPEKKNQKKSKKKNNIIYTYSIKIFIFILVFGIWFFPNYICNSNNDNQMICELNNIFKKFHKINIDNLYSKYHPKNITKKVIIKNIINIEFTLDPNYILETMLTVSSILSTQKNTTKIVFHFGVINNFTPENMLKIYSLKNKINNLSEFNFYYLKGAKKKMKNFHLKGEACPGKFELPQLLPDNIGKILLFDAGDVIIFKDLTELYNYDMKDYWILGLPEPSCIHYLNNYNSKKYLNIGALIINVTEFKINNIWDKYTKNRNLHLNGQPDQTLLNAIIPDDKKDYFPFTLGVYSIFRDDNSFSKKEYNDYGLKNWLASELNNLPENPKTISEYFSLFNNSIFIHQFEGKWYDGEGLSICRNYAKYFIKLAGIWEVLCLKRPGYCK